MCEYEVNPLTKLLQKSKTLMQNDKVVKEQCWMSSEGQGHNATYLWKGLDLSNNVCEYAVKRLTSEKVKRGKQNFNANC